jgi:hypothetical protein
LGRQYRLLGSNKYQAPLNVMTRRAHEGVVLEAGDHQGVVADGVHQGHLSVAQ